jgi:hypothetical protein
VLVNIRRENQEQPAQMTQKKLTECIVAILSVGSSTDQRTDQNFPLVATNRRHIRKLNPFPERPDSNITSEPLELFPL